MLKCVAIGLVIMNILLVYPKFPISYRGFHYSLEIIGKKTSMPPLGLLTIAAMLPEDWNLRLVDMNVEELSRSDIEWARLVVTSGMLVQHTSMSAVIRECKQVGVPVAVGGPHATSSPERFQDADYLLLDEAELTFPPFLKDLVDRCAKRVYSANGQKPDVTATPIPRFDLLKIDRYASMCIQFSRGCPFACEFCHITTLYGRTPRTKTPQQLVNELQALYDLVVALKTPRSAALARHSLRKRLELLLFAVRALVMRGVLSSYRWDYWQFLGRVLSNHPAKYQLAIKRSIFGHHCIEYTREVVIPRLIDHEARLRSATPSAVASAG